tara:strand:- start:3321 stop:3521 length:201 start_codon:yes stop_codon:yes gene_type:complete
MGSSKRPEPPSNDCEICGKLATNIKDSFTVVSNEKYNDYRQVHIDCLKKLEKKMKTLGKRIYLPFL